MDKVSFDTLELCDIEITSTTGKVVPIKNQVISLSIYESIFQPLLTCELALLDAIALAHDLPLVGEELLTVRLKTPVSKQIEYQFVLHNLGNLINDSNNRSQAYTIMGISTEAISDSMISVQKGYFDTCDAIVKDILTSFLRTQKQINTISTKGPQQIIIPNMNPLRSIDFVRQKSVSNKHGYSPVMFFETSSGFYFADIVSLFQEAKFADLAAITRYYRQNNHPEFNHEEGDSWKNMITYRILSSHDTLIKTHSGAFYNNLNKFDLFKKQFKEQETKLTEVYKSFDLVDQGQFNTDSLINNLSVNGAKNYMVYTDGSRPETHIDYTGPKVAFSTLLFQNMIEAEFHGDLDLQAGGVLYLSFTKSTGMTGDEPDQEDTKQSGYHMITKLAHHITINNEPMLRTSCELVKGSYKDIKGKL